MRRLFKALLVLAAIVFAALSVYAYLGDYAPAPREIVEPVILDAG